MTAPVVDGSKARASLLRLKEAVRAAIGQTLRLAVDEAYESAKGTDLFKDQTGGTRRSIKKRLRGLSGMVSAAGAAVLLERGTRAHTHTLRFLVGGEVLYRKMVKHPGTAPRPFMTEARRKGQEAVEYGAKYFIGAAIRGAR